MKKNIAIITGGDSSELVISLKSAGQVMQHIDRDKYEPYLVYIREDDWHVKTDPDDKVLIPVDKNDFSFNLDGREIRFDYAFISMHGPPGEDGKLQAYFDLLHIPYSSSGVLSLALSFNKYACKNILSQAGILSADAFLIRKSMKWDADTIINRTGLPCFIKPNSGGSSFGVSKVNKAEELEAAVHVALEEDSEVLVESFIPGREFTCGALRTGGREFTFPVTEVISKNEFFDYEAKYTEGMATEITPAEIPEELTRKCQSMTAEIYDVLDCRGLVRIDFIINDGELYFLEVNGIPGMSKMSIIPIQLRTLGHTEKEIYNLIIENSI
ncbi:MAG: D-alanine--D-alanine ligase [Bacteroidales bacterium]|nr:D-alanine--D-alanine ligase [Bacteroidales bacterium]